MLRKSLRRSVAVLALLTLASGVASAQTNFQKDVTLSIDKWLEYAKANGGLDATTNTASGLVLLALLEKNAAPANGYINSSLGDQCLERNAVAGIIQAPNHVARGSFYSYVDGIDLLALSFYAKSGGPSPNNTLDVCPVAYLAGITTLSVKDAIDTLVFRTLFNQTTIGFDNGFWGYTTPGNDSSTTQYAVGGLAAAKGFYVALFPASPNIALIDAASARTRTGYKDRQVLSGTEGGWGYRTSGYPASYQQTASGLWASQLGGADINDPAVQLALNFQRNHYNYESILYAYNSWIYSFGYYMFSSSKAYNILETGAPPAVGNIGTSNLGDLASNAPLGRIGHRNPVTDLCAHVSSGLACNGSYAAETPRWYYDYAYTILSRQNVNGSYQDPDGDWAWLGGPGGFWANQAYYELVLERSAGGAVCVDNNHNGICDVDEVSGKTITTLSPAHLWVGLKNSDDVGTQFDVKVDLLKNGASVASGLMRCVTGIARNPSSAKEVVVGWDAFSPISIGAADDIEFQVSTRVGTNADGTKCPGPGGSHGSAVGLRLYYDAATRTSRFDATITPSANADYFQHSDGNACPASGTDSTGVTTRSLNTTAPVAPVASAKCKDSTAVNFAGGNLLKIIGQWKLPN